MTRRRCRNVWDVVRLGIDVAAPSAAAWDCLVDLDYWPQWGPTVRAARLDDGTRRLSAGATGAVQTALGAWLRFEVEEWIETQHQASWSWRVAGIPATAHRVTSTTPSRCRVEMGVPLWGLPYLSVAAVALRRIRQMCENTTSS